MGFARFPGGGELGIMGGLDRTMIAFQFAVALWVIRRGLDVRHAAEPDEFLKILGDKLRLFRFSQPEVARDPTIVLVDLAVATTSIVKFAVLLVHRHLLS